MKKTQDPGPSSALAVKHSVAGAMAERYGMEKDDFLFVIQNTVMPSATSPAQLGAFLLVANEYKLNPVTKEIHAFAGKGGGIVPVVGIDGWMSLANRHPQFDGMTFEYEERDGEVVSCTCNIYRKDRKHPMSVTEWVDECDTGSAPWKDKKRRMIRHKCAIQCIRYAFGFSGIYDEDEAATIAEATAEVISTVPLSGSKQDALEARLEAKVAKLGGELLPKEEEPEPEKEVRPSTWPDDIQRAKPLKTEETVNEDTGEILTQGEADAMMGADPEDPSEQDYEEPTNGCSIPSRLPSGLAAWSRWRNRTRCDSKNPALVNQLYGELFEDCMKTMEDGSSTAEARRILSIVTEGVDFFVKQGENDMRGKGREFSELTASDVPERARRLAVLEAQVLSALGEREAKIADAEAGGF